MSFTNEMARVGAQVEIAQAARSAAVAAIASGVRRDLQKGHATRLRMMAARQKATKSQLKEIFGAAAFLRGAAEDMIDRFAQDQEANGDALRDFLKAYVDELQETVEGQLENFAEIRTAAARRDETARRAYLKDLRRRVHAVLGNADKFMKGLHKDRTAAGRVWEQHSRTTQRLRKAAASGEVASHKRTAKAKRPRQATRH